MNRRRFLTSVAVGASATLAGCTSGSSGGSEPTADSTETTVVAVNTSFDPVRASVEPGVTVTWTNRDSFEHTVVSAQFHDKAAKWSMDVTLSSGEMAEHTFEKAGVYEYYCDVHGRSTMCGVVLVGDASLDKNLPCEGDGGGMY